MLCLAFLHRFVLAILNVTAAEAPPQPPPTPSPAPALVPTATTDLVVPNQEQVAPSSNSTPEVAPAARNEIADQRRRRACEFRGRLFLVSHSQTLIALFLFVYVRITVSFFSTTLFLFILIFYPQVILYAAAPLVYSLWIPQIVRNSKRGSRKALQHRYIIGTSLSRLFLPLC